MSVPYRDPQTGRISQRQRIVWTALPQVHEINSKYSPQEAHSQVYAGLVQNEESVEPFLPLDPALLRTHKPGSIEEESFLMTLDYAKVKLKERIIAHTSQIAREMLMREYGASIRVHEISVEISLQSTIRALYPIWLVTASPTLGSRPMKYLISGISAKVSGLRTYDPMLSGAVVGTTVASLFLFLFSSPVFSFLVLGLAYLAANTIAKFLPVWTMMRREGRRAADALANQQYGGRAQESSSSAGFNPFEAFMGGSGTRRERSSSRSSNPFDNFDPFAGAGSFNGQRRSSDPFYGYGQSGSSQSQSRSRQQGQPQQRATESLYTVLGVPKSASQDDITQAFRKLALSKHPDKVPAEQKASASKEFAKINEAYRVLRNASKREQYDRYGVI